MRPTLGEKYTDRYVPFFWTLFLFILFNNLLGLIPFCGSATGNIFVTAGLALCVFFAIHGSAIQKIGFGHYLTSMWPHIDVPFGLGYILKPLIFALEWRWVPLDHWWEAELRTLDDPDRVGPLLVEALVESRPEPLQMALARLEDRLYSEGVPRPSGRRDLFLELIHPSRAEERAIHGLH